jgi:hypothetical protein
MSEEKDLGSRVYVLESKQEEYDRRQGEQESRARKQEDLISKIASNTAVMNNTLTMLIDQVLPKVNAMDKKVDANTLVTKGALWLAGTVITVAITAIVAMI